MSELEDFEKEPTQESESSALPHWPYWVGALLLVAVIVAVVMLRNRTPEVSEEPTIAPPVAEQAPAPLEKAPLEIGDLPQLDDSDGWLRGLVGQLSAHPELAEWLVTDEMIRRFVAAVDNLAEGTSPRSHLSPAVHVARRAVQGGGEERSDLHRSDELRALRYGRGGRELDRQRGSSPTLQGSATDLS